MPTHIGLPIHSHPRPEGAAGLAMQLLEKMAERRNRPTVFTDFMSQTVPGGVDAAGSADYVGNEGTTPEADQMEESLAGGVSVTAVATVESKEIPTPVFGSNAQGQTLSNHIIGGTTSPSSSPTSLQALLAIQDDEDARYALDFLSKVLRMREVAISREHFLRSELSARGVEEAQVDEAIVSTPIFAGIPSAYLDEIASDAIDVESRGLSLEFVADQLSGSVAQIQDIPEEIIRHYLHTFRLAQKLSYVYGGQTLLEETDDIDDQTLARFVGMLAIMMDLSESGAGVSAFISSIVAADSDGYGVPTKSAWYLPLKNVLSAIGAKVRKAVSAAQQYEGGNVPETSGALPLVSLRSQARRLMEYLRPPAETLHDGDAQ
ncbi:MAG: hypothetical protein Q4C87_01360 [Actinomycetaceae bacterium]|nr:hypothetical protein [Actinomycetaceae bacterium]